MAYSTGTGAPLPGSTPTPPTSTPTPPGTQTGTPGTDVIPGVAGYGQAAALAQEAYAKALADINGQRQTALRQYGYLGSIDPTTGTITGMKVDPNNPYGMYQQMLYGHGVQQEQARWAADARGLGHVGLGAQGVANDQRSFGADSANLSNNLMQTLEGFQSQQDQAYESEQQSLYMAELAAAQQNIASGNFTPADVSSLSPLPPGTPINPSTLAYAHQTGAATGSNNPFTSAAKGRTKSSTPPNAYTSGRKKRG